jgi:hypothetical protein
MTSLNDTGSRRDGSGERDAAELRRELEALRSRRIVRLGLLSAELARRPWRIWRLPWLLLEALRPVRPSPLARVPKGRRGKRGDLRLDPPSRRRRYVHLRVAHIGEPGLYSDLAPHAPLDPGTWRKQLEDGLDLLWLGSAGADVPLGEVMAACAELDTPTVLRLRDPDDLGLLDTGAEPVLVVTDDPHLAEAATARVGDERVLRLEPATDLRRCNPVGWVREPERAVMIVATRAPDAAEVGGLSDLLDAVNGEVTLYLAPGVEADRLPPWLTAGPVETVDGPAALAEAARAHGVALAHPALHDSPTAHARHVLDLLACGTPTVHPPDTVLDRLLPDELRLEAATGTAAKEHLLALADPDVRERASVVARRHVLTHHTNLRRFDGILDRLGIPTAKTPTISVLLSTTRPEFLDHAHAQIARQDYPSLEIITICHGEGFDAGHLERLNARHPHPTKTLHAPVDWPLGDALNLGLDHATGELVSKMDDDDYYGPAHLSDLHLALTYSRADVVGKLANYVYLSGRDLTMDRYLANQESFVWHLPGATMLIHRELLAAYRFSRVRRAVDTALYTRLHADGARRYSTHRFNFVRYRGEQHTYARTDQEFLDQAEHTHSGLALEWTEL